MPLTRNLSAHPADRKPRAPRWHELAHPFLWVTEADLPRLRHNAALPFWRPKFEAWRRELRALDRLEITTSTIDFHKGTNKEALKAAMCWLVDGDEHYGRLVASFLSGVVAFYRKSPDWRAIMGTHGMGYGTGENWGGLTNNHIVDPQMWLSTAHLYDVIHGRGFMTVEDTADFERMMALFYQLSCLHEEMHKMDNNRSVWLCAGGYVSTLFDSNRAMADATRERLRDTMPRFLDTLLEDGWHYEIGGYAPGTVAAMQVFARVIRGAEGVDYFRQKVGGIGLEEFYRTLVYTFLPGSSLRSFCYRDRVNHWESICAGYLEYGIPELGWAVSRIGDRPRVPMFRHWPQGFEFYTYKDPVDVEPPAQRHSHLRATGIAFLRSSWDADASSLYFRYGFQGSSHGGGLDKLNVELTCADEPLIADPILSERSYDKNVVLVDGVCQEQCSGQLLYENLDESAPIQCVSALGGFGSWPKRAFLNDPRAEINYWCTKHEECFPGRARMRRTVAQVLKRVYIIRDTLRSLDGEEHDYEWLWHTFNQPRVDGEGVPVRRHYQPRKRFYAEGLSPVSIMAAEYPLAGNGLRCTGDKADLSLRWSVFGAAAPMRLQVSESPSKYAFNGSPETGDSLSLKMISRLHLPLRGRDVAMTTVFIPTPAGCDENAEVVSTEEHSLEAATITLRVEGGEVRVHIDEERRRWTVDES